MRTQMDGPCVSRKPAFYLALWCALSAGSAQAATPTPQQLSQAQANGLAWLYKNQNGDGSWGASQSGGSAAFATSAVLDAFKGYGISKGIAYTAGVANLGSASPLSTDGRARQISTLSAAGLDVSAMTTVLSQQTVDGTGGWGAFPNYGASILDTALVANALIKASSSGYTTSQLQTLVCNVFGPGQRSVDNGWGYGLPLTNEASSASSSALLPSVYAVLALQNMVGQGIASASNCSNGSSYTLSTMISKGVGYLKTKQNTATDKGFGENSTSSALETALAYLAINAVNKSDTTLVDAQNYLISTQGSNGAWSNDAFVSALALQVFAAPLTISGQDGVPDAVKTALGLASSSATTPNYMGGNGQAVAGTTTPSAKVIGANLGVQMSYALTGAGGTAPYTFTLTSGALPPGVSLGSNTLSGIPTSVGQYNVLITQQDSATPSVSVTQDVQIAVTAHPSAVSFTVSPKPASKLSPATLTATVVGDHPYGTVQFFDGNSTTALATVIVQQNDSAVTATQTVFTTTATLAGGFRKISAVYSGDARNQSATSTTQTVMVNPDAAAVLHLLLQ